MNLKHRNIIILIPTILSTSSLHAVDFSFKAKAGGAISFLTTESTEAQQLPFININDAEYPIMSGADANANPAFFAVNTNVPKGNTDTLIVPELMLGLELSTQNDISWPSDQFAFSPVASIYGLNSDALVQESPMNANLYLYKPLTSVGGDIGVKISNNGNNFQFGGGAIINRSTLKTGLQFSALANVACENCGEPDTTAFQNAEEKPYSADQKTIMPYIYGEMSTEVGDILTAYFKVSYGLETSPSITDAPEDTQMFPQGVSHYSSGHKWELHTVSFGISSEIDSLIS